MASALPPTLFPMELAKTRAALTRTEHALAHTEELLREARSAVLTKHQKFLSTFEQAAVGIAHVDLDGKWLEVNQVLCDIVGYTHEELLELSFQEITHPDDLQEDLGLAAQLFRGDITQYHLEKRYVRKSGSPIWIKLSATLVRDPDNLPLYFVAVIENIHDRKLAEQALAISQRRLEVAMDAARLGMFDFYGPADERNYWSLWVRRHFGIQDDRPLSYERLVKAVHPEDWPRVREVVTACMKIPDAPYHVEYRTIGESDRALRWIEASGRSMLDADTGVIRLVGTTLDITSRKLATMESRANESRIRTAFDNLPDILVIYDRNLVIRYINPVVETTSGMSPSAFIGRREDEIFSQTMIEPWQPYLLAAFEEGTRQQVEVSLPLLPGVRHLSITFVPLRDPHGFVHEVMGIVRDQTDQKKAEQDAVAAALHDPLTGLPNRVLLFDYSLHLFDASRGHEKQGAMLFVDLDRFKLVNDLHGHQIGDELLQVVAARLKSEARESDQVFRLGGDEFLILMPEINDSSDAAILAQRLTETLSDPFSIGGVELQISASTGIALYPRDGDDLLSLLNAADHAMYNAKESGKNRWRFYSASLSERLHEQLHMQSQLRTALARSEFEVFYQPIADIGSGRLVSFEALLRWPAGGVGPERFIPAAEAVGQIIPMGDWVIDQACGIQRRWQDMGYPIIPVAVNISALQLRQPDFLKKLHETLQKHQLEPGALHIELTESTVLEDVEHAIRVLTDLREAGIRISLDDFGTGFSSLSYLSRLPIDKIKIDKSFVQHVMDDTPSRAVTEAIITLGRRLNLEIVAEGIEDEITLNIMQGLGCHQAQGFFIGHPTLPVLNPGGVDTLSH
jgi:diguanylate cyclase (GGDEF)-like protein/PAS domain S-box-containing protein